jgi:anaerobic ribonucleoside-triphosphate reductase activating protein
VKLCDEIKKNFPNKTIWLYTGYEWDEIICKHQFLQSVDVIVDGRFVHELADKNLKWKGSSNQRVIDVQKSLKEGRVVLHG